MSNRIEDEIEAIEYYRILQLTREGKDIGIDEATERFIDKYAEKYAEIWYDGISREELRTKLFMPIR